MAIAEFCRTFHRASILLIETKNCKIITVKPPLRRIGR